MKLLLQASQNVQESTLSDEELLQASQSFGNEEASTSTGTAEVTVARKQVRRFVSKTDDEVKEAAKNAIPIQTRKKAAWAAGLFDEWRMWRNKEAETNQNISRINPTLLMLTKDELDFCLCRFICEIRKADGSEYPGKTSYEIATSLQKYLEMNGIYHKLLSDSDFKQFQLTLDAEMKRKAQEGINKPVKQAALIEEDAEEELWNRGILGGDSPTKLLNTIMYLAGVNFCARGRTEMRNITFGQVSIESEGDGTKKVRYQQVASVKNNQGGLKSRHFKPKDVSVYENKTNPDRCFVRLFQLYISKW